MSGAGEGISALGLAKAITVYVEAAEVERDLVDAFADDGGVADREPNGKGKKGIGARTGRRWLRKIGLKYREAKKGVFIDGHECSDVVEYRSTVFLPRYQELLNSSRKWTEDGNIVPSVLLPGEKEKILITHDESTFYANDRRRFMGLEENKQPLRPKNQGQGIMVSDFLTPIGRLCLPNSITVTESTIIATIHCSDVGYCLFRNPLVTHITYHVPSLLL